MESTCTLHTYSIILAYLVDYKIAFCIVTIKCGHLEIQLQDNNSHIFNPHGNADLLIDDGNHAALQPGLVEGDDVGRHRIALTLHRGRGFLDVGGKHGIDGMFILDVSVEVELG